MNVLFLAWLTYFRRSISAKENDLVLYELVIIQNDLVVLENDCSEKFHKS